MTDKNFLVHVLNELPEEYDTVLDGLHSRLLKTGPEEITIKYTQDKLRDSFEVIKGRSSKKTEKEKALLTKVIKDALQNANLTNEQALTVSNSSKEHVEVVVSLVIKQLNAQTRRLS